MAQSALTVTPENPTPPTNLSFVGASPPLDPTQPVADDGIPLPIPNSVNLGAANGATYNEPSGSRVVFAAKTAAAGSGTSVDAEGKGAETLFTQTYGANIYAPIPLTMDGCGPAYTTTPNLSHASAPAAPTLASIAPTTSVHATATVQMVATGTNFTPTSSIYINGVRQPTQFTSATSIKCQASPPAAAGSVSVTVRDATGRETAPQTWTIS